MGGINQHYFFHRFTQTFCFFGNRKEEKYKMQRVQEEELHTGQTPPPPYTLVDQQFPGNNNNNHNNNNPNNPPVRYNI